MLLHPISMKVQYHEAMWPSVSYLKWISWIKVQSDRPLRDWFVHAGKFEGISPIRQALAGQE